MYGFVIPAGIITYICYVAGQMNEVVMFNVLLLAWFSYSDRSRFGIYSSSSRVLVKMTFFLPGVCMHIYNMMYLCKMYVCMCACMYIY